MIDADRSQGRMRAPAGAWLIALAAMGLAADEAPSRGGVVVIRYRSVEPPVVAQRDVTVRETTSIHPIDPATLPLECSALAPLGRGHLLVVSDRHSHIVFTAELAVGPDAVEVALPTPAQFIASERDLLGDAECATTRSDVEGTTAWVFCSLSNDPSGSRPPRREQAARLRFDRNGRIVSEATRVISLDPLRSSLQEHLDALAIKPYESFNSERGENTNRWGNVEGIAWVPGRDVLLCAMRNPTVAGDALVFAVEGVDEAFDGGDGRAMRIVDLFRLDLGERGASDLAWDPVTGGYLVTAALSNGPRLAPDQPYPRERLDSALYWWSGDKFADPRLAAHFPDMNIEAVCRVEGTSLIAVGSDEGDVSEERTGRQSVITLIHFAAPPEVR